MSILKIKDWKKNKEHQFKMVDGEGIRLKDRVQFNRDSMGKILYEDRKGWILEFMADYVHVQIEVEENIVEYPAQEYISYEYIEVPINDVRRRA